MDNQVKQVLDDMKMMMDKAISHTSTEFSKIRAGKATPSMLDNVHVDYYGNSVLLGQVGNISTPDARTLVVQPWEKNMIQPIEKAIIDSNLGLNPQNDGALIRINIPPLTEERRKNLVKTVKVEAEHARVSLRNIRKDYNERIRKLQKDGISEDDAKEGEGKVQQITDSYIQIVEQLLAAKENEIMTV